MVELFLVLSNLLFGISILGYFFFREVKKREDDSARIEKLDMFYSQSMDTISSMAETQLQTLDSISKSKDDLTQKTLMEYLKHNERLEKMILPSPVTAKAVREILDQTPPMVPQERENEIDKVDEELQQAQLDELLTKLPITPQTKVKFEEDGLENGLAEEILPGVFTGKVD